MASHHNNKKDGYEMIVNSPDQDLRESLGSKSSTTKSIVSSVDDALKAADLAQSMAEEALRRIEQVTDTKELIWKPSIDLAQNRTEERTTQLRRRWRV